MKSWRVLVGGGLSPFLPFVWNNTHVGFLFPDLPDVAKSAGERIACIGYTGGPL